MRLVQEWYKKIHPSVYIFNRNHLLCGQAEFEDSGTVYYFLSKFNRIELRLAICWCRVLIPSNLINLSGDILYEYEH